MLHLIKRHNCTMYKYNFLNTFKQEKESFGSIFQVWLEKKADLLLSRLTEIVFNTYLIFNIKRTDCLDCCSFWLKSTALLLLSPSSAILSLGHLQYCQLKGNGLWTMCCSSGLHFLNWTWKNRKKYTFFEILRLQTYHIKTLKEYMLVPQWNE